MIKMERDGKVAVLVSPGFGAGWSTWNGDEKDTLLFDAEIVQAVLDGDNEKAGEIALQKCPDAYLGGADKLVVEWLDKGTAFKIDEYDGSESLSIIGDKAYSVA